LLPGVWNTGLSYCCIEFCLALFSACMFFHFDSAILANDEHTRIQFYGWECMFDSVSGSMSWDWSASLEV
jgi:hypothetical protein